MISDLIIFIIKKFVISNIELKIEFEKMIIKESSLITKIIEMITISKRDFLDDIVLEQLCLFFKILFFELITKELSIFTIIKNVNDYLM